MIGGRVIYSLIFRFPPLPLDVAVRDGRGRERDSVLVRQRRSPAAVSLDDQQRARRTAESAVLQGQWSICRQSERQPSMTSTMTVQMFIKNCHPYLKLMLLYCQFIIILLLLSFFCERYYSRSCASVVSLIIRRRRYLCFIIRTFSSRISSEMNVRFVVGQRFIMCRKRTITK